MLKVKLKASAYDMDKYFLPLLILLLSCCGCVERLITVTSAPPGAIVWLNGEEVGATPVTTAFTWYGDYEVILRKPGYETVITSRKAVEPWFQWPGVDLFTECVLPINFKDQIEWNFPMTSQTPADPTTLIDRAQEMRTEALTNP
jgi:hypothetical protein